KAIQRRRGTAIAATLVLASLLAATSVSILFAMREAAARARESQQRERAEVALRDEARQRQLADDRAAETRKVAQFQSDWLSDIDPGAMGQAIIRQFRDEVRVTLRRKRVGESPN